MGFIPQGAKWYLADIVIQIDVEGDSRTVVHTSTVLVRADRRTTLTGRLIAHLPGEGSVKFL